MLALSNSLSDMDTCVRAEEKEFVASAGNSVFGWGGAVVYLYCGLGTSNPTGLWWVSGWSAATLSRFLLTKSWGFSLSKYARFSGAGFLQVCLYFKASLKDVSWSYVYRNFGLALQWSFRFFWVCFLVESPRELNLKLIPCLLTKGKVCMSFFPGKIFTILPA